MRVALGARRRPPDRADAGREPAARGSRLADRHSARDLGDPRAGRPSDVRRAAPAERGRRSDRARGHHRADGAGRASPAACCRPGICRAGIGAQQNATHQRTAGRSSTFARSALVVVEVALACVLLVGAGLLFRSFDALLQVDLGFQPQHAMAWRVDCAARASTAAPRQTNTSTASSGRVAALPGVEAVGLSDVLPLGRNRTWGVRAKGVEYPPGQGPSVFPRMVDQHYLQAMQIPLRAGRFFDDRDTATGEKTVIINEHLARELWPDRDAIGQQITQNGGSTVIGVVANVRHGSLEKAGGNEMYLHYRQSGDWQGMEMVVRSARPPASLVPDVRARARHVRSEPADRRVLPARTADRQRRRRRAA